MGAEIHLLEVSDKSDGLWDRRRFYSVEVSDGSQSRLEFRASQYKNTKGWDLELVVCSPDYPKTIGITIDPISLLGECIKHFLEDVPDANVVGVIFDLEMDESIWRQLEEQIKSELRRMPGKEKRTNSRIDDLVRKYIGNSLAIRAVGKAIAKQANSNFRTALLDSDAVTFLPEYYGKPWSELADVPGLGIKVSSLKLTILLDKSPSKKTKAR